MMNLTESLSKACSALGLRIELGFRFSVPSGRELLAVARIADLGAPNGMLVFLSYDEIQEWTPALLKAGYGYSVMDEPRVDEEFDLESYQDMFRDWGWSGELRARPNWIG
jgi:hypothetical protein